MTFQADLCETWSETPKTVFFSRRGLLISMLLIRLGPFSNITDKKTDEGNAESCKTSLSPSVILFC